MVHSLFAQFKESREITKKLVYVKESSNSLAAEGEENENRRYTDFNMAIDHPKLTLNNSRSKSARPSYELKDTSGMELASGRQRKQYEKFEVDKFE